MDPTPTPRSAGDSICDLFPIPDAQIPTVAIDPCRICGGVPVPVQDTRQDLWSLGCCQTPQTHRRRHRAIQHWNHANSY